MVTVRVRARVRVRVRIRARVRARARDRVRVRVTCLMIGRSTLSKRFHMSVALPAPLRRPVLTRILTLTLTLTGNLRRRCRRRSGVRSPCRRLRAPACPPSGSSWCRRSRPPPGRPRSPRRSGTKPAIRVRRPRSLPPPSPGAEGLGKACRPSGRTRSHTCR